MNTTDAAVVRACQRVLRDVASDQRYAHTSQLLVRVSGREIFHEHWQGPAAAPVFSVTKSLVATALGAMDAQQLLPDVHSPLGITIPQLAGHASAGHTWHQVMSMTRGAQVDGPWDSDAVALLPRGQVSHIAAAPQVTCPGLGIHLRQRRRPPAVGSRHRHPGRATGRLRQPSGVRTDRGRARRMARRPGRDHLGIRRGGGQRARPQSGRTAVARRRATREPPNHR